MLKLAQNTSASICCAHSSSPFSRWDSSLQAILQLNTMSNLPLSTWNHPVRCSNVHFQMKKAGLILQWKIFGWNECIWMWPWNCNGLSS